MLTLLAAAGVSAALALYAYSRRDTPGAREVALLMLAVSVWSLGYALEFASPRLEIKVLCAKVEYLGIVTVPAAWLAFALRYTGREKWLTPHNLVILAIIPAITLVLVATNEAHGLVWSRTALGSSGTFLLIDHGPWFWVFWLYSYVLLTLGTLLLVSMLVRSPRLYRRQGLALLVAVAAPWVGNGMYVLGLNPFPNLDLTSFAFLITGLAFSWGLFRFRLLDIVPVARDVLIEGMEDGVIVVDPQGRVVDLNPTAQRILDLPASEAVGNALVRIAPGLDTLIEGYGVSEEAHKEVELGEGPRRRSYELALSALRDREARRTGCLLVLRDITSRKRAEERLREAEERYRTLVEQIPAIIYIEDIDTQATLYDSPQIETILGYPADTYQKDPRYWEKILYPEDLERVMAAEVEARGRGEFKLEYRCIAEDGRAVWIRDEARLVRDEEGEPRFWQGVIFDITERKRTEGEMIRQRAELARSNAELEHFAYLIAHDLRAPLRGIDGFSHILLEDYADRLDEEGRNHLQRVRAGALRMGRLIDELLELSQLTRTEMRHETVNLSALAKVVAAELEHDQPQREVEFVISDGLTANGDARLLRVALWNLLDNAWKFTEKEPRARIEFGASQRGGEPVYHVADNGVGFDMAYADKLFGVFERLHGSEEFEGTGIGLATVQRVVERHGGNVWAEGAVGKGATFFFTLHPGRPVEPA